jgi:predicted flap endonuclease-1-like 5' DNA nuclease
LDDFEFQCFIKLREWRLQTYTELQIEPYKVFQNRTLCELLRRRRDDPSWARQPATTAATTTAATATTAAATTAATTTATTTATPADIAAEGGVVSEKVVEDLLMCWGIGPIKVQQPDGFALRILGVLDSSEVSDLLKQSLLKQSSQSAGNGDEEIGEEAVKEKYAAIAVPSPRRRKKKT